MTEQPDHSSATTFVRRPGLHAVEMDGELVMMGHEQGEYYGLKDVAASLWEHLAEPRTAEELCALVADEYDVTADACRADVVAFLDELAGKDLIERR
ncbi:MAG: PqqD family protein [Propionibacteriales bacterium]|nr:PqqD family protein [Propionibacteriales bacterium]